MAPRGSLGCTPQAKEPGCARPATGAPRTGQEGVKAALAAAAAGGSRPPARRRARSARAGIPAGPGAPGSGPRPLPLRGGRDGAGGASSSAAGLLRAPLSLLPSRRAARLAALPPLARRTRGFSLGGKSVVRRLPGSNAERLGGGLQPGIPEGESVLGPSQAALCSRAFCGRSPPCQARKECALGGPRGGQSVGRLHVGSSPLSRGWA